MESALLLGSLLVAAVMAYSGIRSFWPKYRKRQGWENTDIRTYSPGEGIWLVATAAVIAGLAVFFFV
jgi:heme/copper-type cytochrome/quinol oxidase subunit 2